MLRKILATSVVVAGVVAIAPSAMAQVFGDSAVVEFTGDIDFDCQISATQNGTLRANTSAQIVTQSRGRADIACNVPYKLVVEPVIPDGSNPSTTTASVTLFTTATGTGRFSGLGSNGTVSATASEITLNPGSRAVYPAVNADVQAPETELAPGIYSYSVLLSINNP